VISTSDTQATVTFYGTEVELSLFAPDPNEVIWFYFCPIHISSFAVSSKVRQALGRKSLLAQVIPKATRLR
jgi:hypothetical protein